MAIRALEPARQEGALSQIMLLCTHRTQGDRLLVTPSHCHFVLPSISGFLGIICGGHRGFCLHTLWGQLQARVSASPLFQTQLPRMPSPKVFLRGRAANQALASCMVLTKPLLSLSLG